MQAFAYHLQYEYFLCGPGVLQGSGRPFGDLSRALLASERLSILGGPAFNMRDTAIILYHLKRYNEAYDAFKQYQSSDTDAEIEAMILPAVPKMVSFS